MTYEIGDYVMKPMTGVCRIDQIMSLDMDGVSREKLYYLLVPMNEQHEKIYVPVETADFSMRKCISQEEARKLIEEIPQIEVIWIDNEKMREQQYKEAVKKNDPYALVSVIKMTYQRKKARLEQGKKSTAADERYFQTVENLLYAELGLALGKPANEISHLITKYMNDKKNGEKNL